MAAAPCQVSILLAWKQTLGAMRHFLFRLIIREQALSIESVLAVF